MKQAPSCCPQLPDLEENDELGHDNVLFSLKFLITVKLSYNKQAHVNSGIV